MLLLASFTSEMCHLLYSIDCKDVVLLTYASLGNKFSFVKDI